MALIGKVRVYNGSEGEIFDIQNEMIFTFGTAVSGLYGEGDLVRFVVEGVGTTASGTLIELLT
jgi:hypothetical protein